jgi:hypothetical protein
VRAVPFAAVLVLLLIGCAGSVSRTYSLDKTRDCLRDEGARIGPPRGDVVASTASNGTFRAYLAHGDGNFVTLSFGADEQEAAALAAGYDRFHAKNVGVADILFTQKNVAMLWKLHPSTDDGELVNGCLK